MSDKKAPASGFQYSLTNLKAVDSGKISLKSSFDARGGLTYGKFTIHDYHAQNRVLTVPEIFTYSSNVGTARMALSLGIEHHKWFLRKMGQLDRLRTELPESAEPLAGVAAEALVAAGAVVQHQRVHAPGGADDLAERLQVEAHDARDPALGEEQLRGKQQGPHGVGLRLAKLISTARVQTRDQARGSRPAW